MRQFKDAGGRFWNLSVSVGSHARVREATGVVLASMFDEQLAPMAALSKDNEKIASVLWVLCEKQAEKRCFTDPMTGEEKTTMTPDDFADSLLGDSLAEAWEALVRSTADFFTSQDRRDAAHAILDKINEMATGYSAGIATAATELLSQVNAGQVVKSMLNSVTSGLASPELTPIREQQGS